MSDLIDRQKAISTAENMYGVCDTGNMTDYKDLVIEALEVLPSAEPQLIRCKDCKFFQKGDEFYDFCNSERSMYAEVNEDDFCSYAERKEMQNEQTY